MLDVVKKLDLNIKYIVGIAMVKNVVLHFQIVRPPHVQGSVKRAYNLLDKGEHKASEILELLKISKTSFYRYIEYVKNDLGKKGKL